MNDVAGAGGAGLDRLLRVAFWGAAGLLLAAPLVAMLFTAEVNWGGEDFVFAAVLLGAVGLAFEATMRASRSWSYRFGAGFAAGAAFVTVWANAAVGMIGDGENVYSLLFLGVIALALVGAVAVRFRAGGMAVVMFAAAVAHLGIAVAGVAEDPLGGTYSAVFAAFWLISALLFRQAAGDR
jgi:hypothetical protein